MSQTTLLSSKEVSQFFTNFSPATIKSLAVKGQVPVAAWIGKEPFFARDVRTIRAIVCVVRFGHARY
jgi:hypothetical protein